MDREEAIQVLESMKSEESYNALIDLCNMAIEALNNTTDKPNDVIDPKNDVIDRPPTAPTIEKCGNTQHSKPTDLISRADVLELAEKGYIISNSNYKKVCDLINALPSVESVQGVGRYENAMQKLREMPRYLNGVKVKQIKKIPSEAVPTEPPTDMISRADAIKVAKEECENGTFYDIPTKLEDIPSADRPSGAKMGSDTR